MKGSIKKEWSVFFFFYKNERIILHGQIQILTDILLRMRL